MVTNAVLRSAGCHMRWVFCCTHVTLHSTLLRFLLMIRLSGQGFTPCMRPFPTLSVYFGVRLFSILSRACAFFYRRFLYCLFSDKIALHHSSECSAAITHTYSLALQHGLTKFTQQHNLSTERPSVYIFRHRSTIPSMLRQSSFWGHTQDHLLILYYKCRTSSHELLCLCFAFVVSNRD